MLRKYALRTWENLPKTQKSIKTLTLYRKGYVYSRGYSRGKKDTPAYKKSLCKWGHFEKAKTTLKMLLASCFLMYFFKRFRSFNAKNLESVGQRVAKLLAIKLWEWLDRDRNRTRADWFEWGRGRPADFFLRPPTLTASNFAALWSTDLKSLAKKDLNFSKKFIKNQEASSILRVIFAISK